MGSRAPDSTANLERRDFCGFVVPDDLGPRAPLTERCIPDAGSSLAMLTTLGHGRISEIE
jgi:hypothetical protein